MKKALVVFALREEFAPWKRRQAFRDSLPGVSLARIGQVEVHATLAGAGCRALELIKSVTSQVGPDIAIITGVAAGLRPEWQTGEVFSAKSICSPDGEHLIESDARLLRLATECGAKPASTLVTLNKIVRTVSDKRKFGNTADAADMESLPLMEFWAGRGIPSIAVRAILDAVDAPIRFDFEAAMDREGQIQSWKVAGQALRHPALLPGLLHLARQNRTALHRLADFLDRFIESWNRGS